MDIVRRSRYQQLNADEEDPEVRYIAYWLRRNTRDVDDREYAITYRELRRILSRYGFELKNANNNYIDLIKIQPRSGVLAMLIGKEQRTRVARIGFPGDTKQVNKGDLRKIRKLCDLTSRHGVDSQSFYRGVDDMTSLLAEYQENLRRLANR